MSPMNRSLYPVNWNEISRAVRQRANWKCEKCGVKHGSYIMRLKHDPSQWYYTYEAAKPGPDENKIKVVLTVHHVGVDKPDGTPGNPGDKMDCRSENLQALCQRCHLLADLDQHIANRKQNRAARNEQEATAAGQLRLELE